MRLLLCIPCAGMRLPIVFTIRELITGFWVTVLRMVVCLSELSGQHVACYLFPKIQVCCILLKIAVICWIGFLCTK